MKPVTELDDDLWNAVINVNLTGPMRVFRATIPEMEMNGGGVFVTVASLGGIKAGVAGSAYIASKHGVLGLAKNVAYMYADKNIRSNVIAPGGVKTEMGTDTTGVSERGMGRCMLGMGTMPRQGEPEEIAQLALFLASDDASLINGAVVTADAGWGAALKGRSRFLSSFFYSRLIFYRVEALLRPRRLYSFCLNMPLRCYQRQETTAVMKFRLCTKLA